MGTDCDIGDAFHHEGTENGIDVYLGTYHKPCHADACYSGNQVDWTTGDISSISDPFGHVSAGQDMRQLDYADVDASPCRSNNNWTDWIPHGAGVALGGEASAGLPGIGAVAKGNVAAAGFWDESSGLS